MRAGAVRACPTDELNSGLFERCLQSNHGQCIPADFSVAFLNALNCSCAAPDYFLGFSFMSLRRRTPGPSPVLPTTPYFQADANFSAIIFNEMNTSSLKSLLYLYDRREISFHHPLNLFDPP
jgi:hypothetical protein